MLSMCVFYFIFNTHLFYHVAIWHLLKYKLHYKLTVLLLLGYYIELACDANANMRMSSLKTERHSLALAVLTCRLTKQK